MKPKQNEPTARETAIQWPGSAQGDGEVSITAIECPADAQLTLDLRDDLVLKWPIARLPVRSRAMPRMR